MDLNLTNKVALITGGSRGIGRATALRFAAEGCNIALCARGQAGIDKTLEEIRAHDVEAFGLALDVAEPGETERFVNAAADELGGVDILVNNVGGTAGSRELLTSTDADWQQTFDLNLFHAVRASRAAIPHMTKRNGGSIVTISSISGWKPANRGAQYGATKAAEIFLAGALAWELAAHNIRVNTVCPWLAPFPRRRLGSLPKRNARRIRNISARANFPHSDSARTLKSPISSYFSHPIARVGSTAHPFPLMAHRGRPTAF